MSKFVCPILLACLAVGIVCFGTGGGKPETPSTVVNTCCDTFDRTDGFTSLREAIVNAKKGDTITFAGIPGGTIIELEQGCLKIDKGITIDARSNPQFKYGGITIYGRGKDRIFTVAVPPGSGGAELIGLVVTGGKAEYGGGILVDRSALTLTDTAVIGNSADKSGGGIYVKRGALTMTNSAVSGNFTEGSGGGIGTSFGSGCGGGRCDLTIADSTVSRNSAGGWGGGICSCLDTASIINTEIVGNVARISGGGMIVPAGELRIADSTISENSAGKGGGVATSFGSFGYGGGSGRSWLTITDSAITRNAAGHDVGGGICNDRFLSVVGSTISGNIADGNGGGFHNQGTLTIVGSTISDNTTIAGSGGGGFNTESLTLRNSVVSGNFAYLGGGLSDVDGTMSLTNVTVAGNSSRSGGGVDVSGEIEMFNSIVAMNKSRDDGGDLCGPLADRISGSNNMVGGEPGFAAAPVFEIIRLPNGCRSDRCLPFVEKWKLSNADALDLSLLEGSAAIDAGSNDAAEAETDLAGNPRIAGAAVDLGAYEYQGNPDAAESARESAAQ